MTALPRFPTKAELVERYGRRADAKWSLHWFEALALWKAAVFCEAIYGRFVRGELGAEDERAAPAASRACRPRGRRRGGSRER